MTDILTVLHDGAMVIVTACAPLIAYKLLSLVGLQADANAVTVVTNALDRGANMALDHAVAVGDPLMLKAETKSKALRIANDYVANAASTEAAKLGVAEAALATKIEATLAGKLHVSAMLAAVPPPPATVNVVNLNAHAPYVPPVYAPVAGQGLTPVPLTVPVEVVGQPAT